jgi:ubiquinone/menaquinone biosynthesis C-methylase UbiE
MHALALRVAVALLFAVSSGCESRAPDPVLAPPSKPAPEATSAIPAPAPAPASAADAAGTSAVLPPSANPGINDRYKTSEGRAVSIQIFEGSERGAFQKPADVIKLLKLRQGDVVADVGAGSGYMTAALSTAVGPKGKVYAEDISVPFLDEVRAKIEKGRLENVEVVLGTETNARLPAACCDAILVLDTYHHFEWPGPMLASMKKALKPSGRLVIIEFHRKSNPLFESLKTDYKKHIRLEVHEVVKQIEELGWRKLEMNEFPPYQYVVVFTPGG